MKQWNMPELVELDLRDTEHNWTGIYRDGGYIGDGVVTGHLSWDKNDGCDKPTPTPSNPAKPLS